MLSASEEPDGEPRFRWLETIRAEALDRLEEHGELAGLRQEVLQTVAAPERIVAGQAGELLAIRELESGKWLVVAYRELGDDGFVITAFLTRRLRSFEKRKQLWP